MTARDEAIEAAHPPLTDLIGLAPNLTGGRSVEDHLRDQYCDGPHLDEAAIRADERRKAAIEFAEVVENTAFSISQVFGRSPKDYLDEAARRIRKIGGAS